MSDKRLSSRGYALRIIDTIADGMTGPARKNPMRTLFKAQKKQKQSTVDIVIGSIRELLLARKLVPGQRIPSESEISNGLGVSRGSVREAMKILAAFGVVEIRVGDGTYIPSEPKAALIDPLLFSFLLYNPNIEEVMEFRLLLELDVVELIIAHKNKNSQEREALAENLAQLIQMRSANASAEEFARNDMEFHRLLGCAACNKLTQRIYDFALDYLEHTIYETHNSQFNGANSYEVHRRILDAIETNNLEVAAGAIQHSVDVWRDLQHSQPVPQP